MKTLTKREIALVRKGANTIAKDTPTAIKERGNTIATIYSCEAVGFGDLAVKLKKFYDPPMQDEDNDHWVGLPYGMDEFTVESQLQRELMLELFAHLKGVI